jgi:hypothetical protein
MIRDRAPSMGSLENRSLRIVLPSMNALRLIISFSPWIVFGLLAGSTLASLTFALILALVLTIVTSFHDLRRKNPMSWVTLIYFVIMIVVILGLKQYFLSAYLGIFSMAVLAAFCWGSIVVREPFTLAYAREGVDPARANSPSFIRANYVIAAAWGLAFLVNLAIDIVAFYNKPLQEYGFSNITWVIIVLVLAFTIWYPGYARKRAMQAAAQAANRKAGTQ